MLSPKNNPYYTLPQLILFLSDNLILYEQKCKERSDYKVKSPYSGNDIVVIDVFVLADGELGVVVVYFFHSFINVRKFYKTEDCVVDQKLNMAVGCTFREVETSSIGRGSSMSWKITESESLLFKTKK